MDYTENRFREHVGIVVSDTSSGEFSFFVTPLSNKLSVSIGDYVQVDHPFLGGDCPLLAIVKEIRNYEEVIGTSIGGNKSVKTIARTEIRGCVDLRDPQRKVLQQLLIPPNPGSKVYLPYFQFLEDVFTRNERGVTFESVLHIGKQNFSANSANGGNKPLNFYLNAVDLMHQHILITAISRSGKTHTATVIIEELANKTDVPIVILDPYGEYTTIGASRTAFTDKLPGGQPPMTQYPFNYQVVIFAVHPERVENDLESIGITLKNHSTISVAPFFNQTTNRNEHRALNHKLYEEIKPNQITILNLKGLTMEKKCQKYTAFIHNLWSTRLSSLVEPCLLIVEEPQILAEPVLKMLAAEGKKNGITMCLLSQHPSEMNRRILSQMGTQIIGRTIDVQDLQSLTHMARDKLEMLPQLKTGEWIINGIHLHQPAKIQIRDRYTLKS